MLKFHSYNIVFQEVPGEVTLAFNLTNCPNGCKGCHSPYLQEDIGETLDKSVIADLLAKYGNAVTCVGFMGGDADPLTVEKLSCYIRELTHSQIKTAWYSGRQNLPKHLSIENFNYIKLGPYIESLGGLDSPATNQRFYRIDHGAMIDETFLFRKKSNLTPKVG
ncbi:MAG: anaerobic ribonucleoside-triphosphate reductase activating protein [Microbacter sp.]